MAYIIYNNDGTILVTIADGDVDENTTNLTLVGKNVNNYGQYINNNLTKLLSNFSGSDEPDSTKSLIGQMWYDTSNKILKVFNGNSYETAFAVTFDAASPSNTSTGELWYDADDLQLKIWNSSTFATIGPAVSPKLGKFGIEPISPTLSDRDFSELQDVSAVYSYTRPTMLLTTGTFVSSSSSTLYYFGNTSTQVVDGVTILKDLDVRGNLYVQGTHRLDKNISMYYDTTGVANIDTDIAAVLEKMYPVTTSSYSTNYYTTGSEARVLCSDAGVTSVRRFYIKFTDLNGTRWEPDDRYWFDATTSTTSTNIIP
jgi:hypothetical protein